MGKIILILLVSFLQIGLFSIGGGYATIPLIQEQVVNIHQWLNMQEFTDVITISQMTPGPLAVNLSTFVGMRIAGILGAIIATFGCIISGLSISIFFYNLFEKYKKLEIIFIILKGLRSISVGLIGASACMIFFMALDVDNNMSKLHDVNIYSLFIFIICIFLLKKYKLNPMFILLLSGAAGLLR